MPALTVYEKPTCTTCRNLAALLKERGVDFDSVDYQVLGLTPEQVEQLEHTLRRSGQHRPIARDHHRPLKQLRVVDHRANHALVIFLKVSHAQLRVGVSERVRAAQLACVP